MSEPCTYRRIRLRMSVGLGSAGVSTAAIQCDPTEDVETAGNGPLAHALGADEAARAYGTDTPFSSWTYVPGVNRSAGGGLATHGRSAALRVDNMNTCDSMSDVHDDKGCEGVSSADSPASAATELGTLYTEAITMAEQCHANLRSSSKAWPLLRRLLSQLAAAQRPLLCAELARKDALQARRGRRSRVQFACHDFSALDPPSRRPPPDHEGQKVVVLPQQEGDLGCANIQGQPIGASVKSNSSCEACKCSDRGTSIPTSGVDEQTDDDGNLPLQQMVGIVLLQRVLLANAPDGDRSAALLALCEGLAKASAEYASSGNGCEHLAHVARLRVAGAVMDISAQFQRLRLTGQPVLMDRLSAHLSSRIRHHLHSLFESALISTPDMDSRIGQQDEGRESIDELLLFVPARAPPRHRFILTLLPPEPLKDAAELARHRAWPAKPSLSAAGSGLYSFSSSDGTAYTHAGHYLYSSSEEEEDDASHDYDSEGEESDELRDMSPQHKGKRVRAASEADPCPDARSVRMDTSKQKGSAKGEDSTDAAATEQPGSPTASQLLCLPPGREDGLLGRPNASLASLLSHALLLWQIHTPQIVASPIREVLKMHDLYAKQSLTALPSDEQTDLLGWAEAHTVLLAVFRQRVLHYFAIRAPKHWAAFCRLAELSELCGCVDESHYALLTNEAKLNDDLLARRADALKLLRLLSPQGPATTRLQTTSQNEAALPRIRSIRLALGDASVVRVIDWEEVLRETLEAAKPRSHNPPLTSFGRKKKRKKRPSNTGDIEATPCHPSVVAAPSPA